MTKIHRMIVIPRDVQHMGGGERGERNLTLPSLERIHEVIGVQAIELLMVGLIGLG
jgi:hypothetical protein